MGHTVSRPSNPVWSGLVSHGTVNFRQLRIVRAVQTQSSVVVWSVFYDHETALDLPAFGGWISPCIAQLIIADPLLFVTLSGSGGAQVAGEDYTLTCRGSFFPFVYRWLKDGSLLLETSDTLSFSPLRDTDSGYYTCEITTDSLTGTSPFVVITVVGKNIRTSIYIIRVKLIVS